MSSKVDLCEIAKACRRDILTMIHAAGTGHPGGSLSATDILCALYFGGILKHDAKNPEWEERDRFILCKGHAAPALYAVLGEAGYFDKSEFDFLRKLGSHLQGHPDTLKCPGVEVSTGSLGQGLSISCGIAKAFKLQEADESVFALLGDGECQEGQVWEAAMFAAQNKLDNLIAIIDKNNLQIDGNVDDVMSLGNLTSKFISFGWDVAQVDGHNMEALVGVLGDLKSEHAGKPKCLIAHTTKGKGVSFMENQAGWHGKAPNDDEFEKAMEELA